MSPLTARSLTPLVHHYAAVERWFAMLNVRAYCDDSGRSGHQFVLASILAPLASWDGLDVPWLALLDKYNLAEFKAWACDKGEKEFERFTIAERRTIYEEFISLVASVRLAGIATIIDTHGWNNDIRPLLRGVEREPYYWAFIFEMELLGRSVLDLPDTEAVAVVIDEQKEHRYRSLRLYDEMQGRAVWDEEFSFAKRLRTPIYRRSHELIGLQAADILGYETRCAFGGRPGRWQWEALREGLEWIGLAWMHYQAVRRLARLIHDLGPEVKATMSRKQMIDMILERGYMGAAEMRDMTKLFPPKAPDSFWE